MYRTVLIIIPRQWGQEQVARFGGWGRVLKGNTKGIELFKSGPITGGLRILMGLRGTALSDYRGQESEYNWTPIS